jgi:hypothetical protein
VDFAVLEGCWTRRTAKEHAVFTSEIRVLKLFIYIILSHWSGGCNQADGRAF